MEIFVKETEGNEEKYKENKTRTYLKDSWIDLAKLWYGRYPMHPEGCCAEKYAISVQPLLRYKCVEIMFSWFL